MCIFMERNSPSLSERWVITDGRPEDWFITLPSSFTLAAGYFRAAPATRGSAWTGGPGHRAVVYGFIILFPQNR